MPKLIPTISVSFTTDLATASSRGRRTAKRRSTN